MDTGCYLNWTCIFKCEDKPFNHQFNVNDISNYTLLILTISKQKSFEKQRIYVSVSDKNLEHDEVRKKKVVQSTIRLIIKKFLDGALTKDIK